MLLSSGSEPCPVKIASEGERACADALLDFCRAAPAAVVDAWGLTIEETPEWTAVRTPGCALTPLNRVLALGLDRPVKQAALDRLVCDYYAAERPFIVGVTPVSRPAKVPNWLRTVGCVPIARTAVLCRATDTLPPTLETPFTVQRIGHKQAHLFAHLVCDVSGLPNEFIPWLRATVGRPNWQHYLAFASETSVRMEKRAVAAAALYVRDRIGVLGWAVTAPSHRGQGAQSALVVERLHQAARQGCKVVFVDTDVPLPEKAAGGMGVQSTSFRNLQRFGFRVVLLRDEFSPTQGQCIVNDR
jgi:GNAT superfamily N-acetyltransferase